MGYTTTFTGKLKFNKKLTSEQINKIKSFFGEDIRDHNEWNADGTYIDLILTENMDGVEWDSATEKNNGMVSHINLIIREMRKDIIGFSFVGEMLAQGEDIDDTWKIIINKNGFAEMVELKNQGVTLQCPNCGHQFYET